MIFFFYKYIDNVDAHIACVDVIMCSIIDDKDNISIKPSATTTYLFFCEIANVRTGS